MNNNKFIRLGGSSDTFRKENTVSLQSKLSKDQINEYLKDYIKVSSKNLAKNVEEIPLNTHLRYFAIDDYGNKLFRLGGYLKKKDELGRYIVLSNKDNKTWSVTLNKCILYRKICGSDYKKLLDEFNLLKEHTKNLYKKR
jgi:hypothetical protein